MDLRVAANHPGLINADRLYQQQRSPNSASSTNRTEDFSSTLLDKSEIQTSDTDRAAVLTLPEMATLHVLFGSEKPAESNFYGTNNSSQIYKGHLLDVAG